MAFVVVVLRVFEHMQVAFVVVVVVVVHRAGIVVVHRAGLVVVHRAGLVVGSSI